MSVAAWSGSLLAWERVFVALKEWLAPVFGRRKLRETGYARPRHNHTGMPRDLIRAPAAGVLTEGSCRLPVHRLKRNLNSCGLL